MKSVLGLDVHSSELRRSDRAETLSPHFVTKLDPILQKLAHAQSRLLRTADSVRPDQWQTCPEIGGWSAGELVAHLIMVERAVLGSADRVMQHAPRQISLLKRFHLPLALVEARLIRRKTPIPLDPQLVREKETMLAELRKIRERTLAFVDETKGRDLSKYRWRHAFLGLLNMYEWLQMIACHEIRHEKQLQEIANSYRKP
jgi:DinB superfamily